MTETAQLTIERATAKDSGTVLQILCNAAARQRRLSHHGWERFSEDQIRKQADQRIVYVAYRTGEAVATFCLQWEDPLWKQDGEEDKDYANAGYLHKLAVVDSAAGEGIGAQIIAWAEEQVRERGRHWLRLDCLRDNAKLRAYYERQGFKHVRDRHIDQPYDDTSLYEKKVA